MNSYTTKAKDMGIQEIYISAKRWFSKTEGNTYHKVYIDAAINGKRVRLGGSGITYGYGDHYLVTAGDWLKEHDFLDIERGYEVAKWRFRESNFIHDNVDDVRRKRDL